MVFLFFFKNIVLGIYVVCIVIYKVIIVVKFVIFFFVFILLMCFDYLMNNARILISKDYVVRVIYMGKRDNFYNSY